jgi:hypothetical protein
MAQFFASNGITHIRVPAYSPWANGQAESCVGTFKAAMKRMLKSDTDIGKCLEKWLLFYRNTPHNTTKQAPSVLMLGRPTRTLLSLIDPLTRSKPGKQVQEAVDSRNYRFFDEGDQVLFKTNPNSQWIAGVVVCRKGLKVYGIQSGDRQFERHIDQMQRAAVERENTPGEEFKTLSIPPVVHRRVHEPTCIPEQVPKPVVRPAVKEHSVDIERPVPSITVRPSTETAHRPIAPVVRSSAREKSVVQRFNYSKLGGP